MPTWSLYAIAAVAGVVLIVGAVFLGRWLWRLEIRRHVIRLVARKEAILAGYRSLADVAGHLAQADDEHLMAFAGDMSQIDRRALVEVHARQRILHEELEVMALPKRLWDAAEKLALAAAALEYESGRVGESATADQALAGLAAIDLSSARAAVEAGEQALHACCEAYGVEDASVYGGGLYI